MVSETKWLCLYPVTRMTREESVYLMSLTTTCLLQNNPRPSSQFGLYLEPDRSATHDTLPILLVEMSPIALYCTNP